MQWSCGLSLVEVYNETVVDLLDVDKGYLQLRESRSGRVYVENVQEELVVTGTCAYIEISPVRHLQKSS